MPDGTAKSKSREVECGKCHKKYLQLHKEEKCPHCGFTLRPVDTRHGGQMCGGAGYQDYTWGHREK